MLSCLPEFRPKILEAGGTFGLLLWGRVLVFQNSYIQQIQGLFLESSSKPHVVAGTGNAEDSQVLVLWGLGDKFNNSATMVLWWKRDKGCLYKSWGATWQGSMKAPRGGDFKPCPEEWTIFPQVGRRALATVTSWNTLYLMTSNTRFSFWEGWV